MDDRAMSGFMSMLLPPHEAMLLRMECIKQANALAGRSKELLDSDFIIRAAEEFFGFVSGARG